MRNSVLAAVVVMVVMGGVVAVADTVVDFESPALSSTSYYGGAGSNSGNFVAGGVTFPHSSEGWSWSGFSYSNMTDNETLGSYGNQFSAITGQGVNGSNQYGIGYMPLDWANNFSITPIQATFSSLVTVSGVHLTNTAYAYGVMKNGDSSFGVDPFGGVSGSEPDYLKLLISGIDANGQKTSTVEFFLGDYRGENEFLLDSWSWVNLSSLGTVKKLEFSIQGSDVGTFGLNTPSYFAMDDLTFVPEPATLTLLGLGWVGMLKKRK